MTFASEVPRVGAAGEVDGGAEHGRRLEQHLDLGLDAQLLEKCLAPRALALLGEVLADLRHQRGGVARQPRAVGGDKRVDIRLRGRRDLVGDLGLLERFRAEVARLRLGRR